MSMNIQDTYQHLVDMRKKVIAAKGGNSIDSNNKSLQKSERSN